MNTDFSRKIKTLVGVLKKDHFSSSTCNFNNLIIKMSNTRTHVKYIKNKEISNMIMIINCVKYKMLAASHNK